MKSRPKAFDETGAWLRTLVADNPPPVARVDEVTRLHERWIAEAATPEVAIRRSDGLEPAATIVASGAGRLASLAEQYRV